MDLQQLGWTTELEERFSIEYEGDYIVGRVALEHKRMYRVFTAYGELLAEVTGKLRHEAATRNDFPAVGDWVVLAPRLQEGKATIVAILPRKSKFSRKMAGVTTEEQIVAANIDTVFLVNALTLDLNVRRIERYLLLAWESGANPVIILSKADLCPNVEEKVQAVEAVALGVPIHVISAEQNQGIEHLKTYVEPGQSVALLGSSGVGKSTLVNVLFGEEKQAVKQVREDDDKGRHTTTHRELVVIKNGGVVIDTPGMRELQLWEADSGISQSFQDIEQFIVQCRFSDCRHEHEPGCAVIAAIESGELEQQRYFSYLKLQRELAYLARKEDKRAELAAKKKWKKMTGDRTRLNRP
ncbi:GTPase RsgA [Fictibacillus macauensis ZFHKF-1]|uniref:Small ribosomal subunit biogenesis GTPase RsgA n=1 Tax=Fictibacillus macauensis ZFHKF-1 TaxID=1196324 RepID=I8UCP8_9BACL|nr:ribosome small subunit-dependent GTPase A [Fictibacillus macauensis]EIT84700.1 GTPase RsgA [Fictibacillus macauensis ZFHKF-1]